MPYLSHSISKFRLATVCLTVAAGLLVTAYWAVLEWRQAFVCREFRSAALTAEDFWFILPWIVVLICQCATMRRSKFGIAFYTSFVLSLAIVLMEMDELVISSIQGRGLWMPEWLFCDQSN
jgi:cell division protein FtsX